MEYTVKELAQMSGVSIRTLHYYDEIGLLQPMRIAGNGYRIYRSEEVDKLQQILFYRELGLSLKKIQEILATPDLNKEKELEDQLLLLLQRKVQLEALIHNIKKTIQTWKGETTMNDAEKFEGFKQNLIDQNEQSYGKEIRERFGDEQIEASYAKIKGMSKEQWSKTEELSNLINETLKAAFELGDPASEVAQKACDLHRQWLCMYWKDGTYTKEAHKALAESYVINPKFTAYYDRIAVGCTTFLRDAIAIYCR
ncbi:MerR family transcriptional regulator [Anaerosporobacter faecicola]|uniref:MerR family transcriptional regulator n=1 Tax=Anaerosporobacter faecicola TaxID=2718714 RepID=UPI00143C3A7D|nr:MerR family transcriptional regulator [Anaerosporobacter faecicola]